jgi:hypothetical protein
MLAKKRAKKAQKKAKSTSTGNNERILINEK